MRAPTEWTLTCILSKIYPLNLFQYFNKSPISGRLTGSLRSLISGRRAVFVGGLVGFIALLSWLS